jgi:hypothetical protein
VVCRERENIENSETFLIVCSATQLGPGCG